MIRFPAHGTIGGMRGFTLMELLVSLVLFGILLAAVFGGLRLGTRVWEASTERVEEGGRVLAVHRFLRQRLEEALPIIDNGSALDQGGALDQPVFSGQAGQLRLASSMPSSLGEGIFLLELELQGAAGNDGLGDLILRWRPWPLDPAVDASERVILDGIAGMTIGYFGARDRERAAAWHDRWQDQADLPDIVRVDLSFSDGDRRDWPALIVSPMVDEWYDTND